MKQQLKAFNKYFAILYKRLDVSDTWRRAFGHEGSMIGYLNRVPIVLLGKSSRTYILAIIAFARFAQPMVRNQGFKGFAVYSKACQTLLIKSVAGSPIKSVFEAFKVNVSITRDGLPKLIPKNHRIRIRRGDVHIIRFWSSLFSIFRIVEYLGKPNLKTITRPGRWVEKRGFIEFIPLFFARLATQVDIPLKVRPWEPVLIQKSGPGVVSGDKDLKGNLFRPTTTTAAMVYQAVAISRDIDLHKSFMDVALRLGQGDLLMKLNDIIKWSGYSMPWLLQDESLSRSSLVIPDFLGKLGIKEEPGKVRVFAMVDWWTQMLLRPLHKAIFSILYSLDTDATRDQDSAIERGQKMLAISNFAASYDLSAATDRLPVELQALLLDHWFPKLGEPWKKLLVNRSYLVPKAIRGWGMRIPKSVRYAVGQPMGALSSWAMLALTHHFIVQYAAHSCGKLGWFSQYLILGDDIVIFDKAVAQAYLKLMKTLGVDINLIKSVVSNTHFEFAKRFVSSEKNFSALSFKEMDVASKSLDATMSLFDRIRGTEWSAKDMLKFSGAGYRVLSLLSNPLKDISRYWRNLIIYSSMPERSLNSAPNWLSWLEISKLGSYDNILSLDSLKDKFKNWVSGFKPTRLTSIASIISGPELGTGLRPDEKGVLRFRKLFDATWDLSRNPNPTEEKLIQSLNRILFKASLRIDQDKREINDLWKDIELFWDWNNREESIETLNRMFDTLEFTLARETEPNIVRLVSEPLPKRLAPTMLRLWHNSQPR